MKCPKCGTTIKAMTIAKALGERTSEKKKLSSSQNGKLGGRPKGSKNKPKPKHRPVKSSNNETK